ncbi:MAG: tetratricopeptide repeat protein, partial [Chloroflexi bacterium]|nr:tetratricopeptide repeat protein [Chloroflexota bacterium]
MAEVTLQTYEEEVDQLIEASRYIEAIAHIRNILKQHPSYYGIYYLIGKMMLDNRMPELAIEMFRRVLAANPEHMMARIGLGLAHDQLDNLDAAIWNLERAYELHPGNTDLADELARLYGQRDGLRPDYIPLNRAALARLYMRGNLTSRAVEELRSLLEEEPERVDLQLTLAEAYYKDNQIVQAADTCQQILDYLPYCLKANLLLGTLWVNSGQEEGQLYLQTAQEIDLQNRTSEEMFGTQTLLEPREVTLERLTYDPEALDVDQKSQWFQRLESASVSIGVSEAAPQMTDEEVRLVDVTAELESQIEMPDWLSELGPLGEDEEEEDWLSGFGEEEAAEAIEETTEEFEVSLDAAETIEASVEEGEEAEMPDWLREMRGEEAEAAVIEESEEIIEEEEEIPAEEAWMAGL